MRELRTHQMPKIAVMAGFVPAMPVFFHAKSGKPWMPGTSAGLTREGFEP
jgi:hypothetical protein